MEGYSKLDLFAWYADLDYDLVASIRVANDAPAMTLSLFRDAHLYKRLTQEFFGTPRERRTKLEFALAQY